MHKCYTNPHNLFNQVGLIAINILGQPLPVNYRGELPSGGPNPTGVPKRSGGSKSGAGVQDLAVDMGVDPQTAATLRDVHSQKVAAVDREDYAAAKQLKAIEESLKSVGGRLARLLADKDAAVEVEDYDRAASIKAEVARIRHNIAEQIHAVQTGNFAAAAAAAGMPMSVPQSQGMSQYGGGSGQGYNTGPAGYGGGYGGGGQASTPAHHTYNAPLSQGGPQFNGAPPQQAYGGPNSDPYGQGHSGAFPGQSGPYGQPAPQGGPMGEFRTPGSTPAGHGGGYGAVGGVGHFQGGASPHQQGGKYADDGDDFAVPSTEGFRGGRAPTPPRQQAAPAAFQPSGSAPGGFDERPDSRQIRTQPKSLEELIAADEAAQKAGAGAPPPDLGIGGGLTSAAAAAAATSGTCDPSQLAGVEGVEELPAPDAIKPADGKDADDLAGVFGEYVVQCLFSKLWNLREAAIQKIQLEIPRYEASPAAVFAAVGKLLSRVADKDKIAQVFVSAVQLLPVVLDHCAEGAGKGGSQAALDGATASLVVKLGDNAPKNRDAAVDALLELASRPQVGAVFVAQHCMRKIPKKQERGWRAMHTRLMVLAMLVADHDLLRGVGADALIGFSVAHKAHENANGELREAAKQLVVEIFKLQGAAVESKLGHLNGKQLAEYKAACEAGAQEAQA